MKVFHSFIDLIGHTPIVQLHQIEEKYNLKSHIYAKIESFNPAGSVKDRVAKQMIIDAIDEGKLKPGATIIEPTSGNTGIGLCAVGSTLGFKVIIVMPDSMSAERITLMKAYGAAVVLTPGHLGMSGAIEKANELAASIENSFIPGQFENPSNPKAHYLSTGPEIDEQMNGYIDYFVSGIGTGGTISGTGKYLKERHPNLKVIGVEPADSPLLSIGKAGPHKIQGIGANFVPDALDTAIYDKLITATTDESYECARDLATEEGILAGISSGAALHAAIEIAKTVENKNIVVILPDGGDCYLSTDLYE